MAKKKETAPNQEQQELQAKVQEFLNEYRVLAAKHLFDFHAQLAVSPDGIVPNLVIVRRPEPQQEEPAETPAEKPAEEQAKA